QTIGAELKGRGTFVVRKPKGAKKSKVEIENQRLRRKLLVLERLRQRRLLPKLKSADPRILAMGIAHEFNNILGALDGHAEWALESTNPEDWKSTLEVVRKACDRSSE